MAKCAALGAEGLTARHWAGGYGYPPPTVTGAAQRDVALLESCIGVGEVAVSDHRSSMPSAGELARLARRALGFWVQDLRLRRAPCGRINYYNAIVCWPGAPAARSAWAPHRR